MKSQAVSFSVIALLALIVSACSPTTKSDESTAQIGLAVSEVCPDTAEPQCIELEGENILTPDGFKTAKIETVGVDESENMGQVDLTFTQDGASVLQIMTSEAAGNGGSARLVLKVDGEIHSAVPVASAIEDNQLQIVVSSTEEAQKLAALIQGK